MTDRAPFYTDARFTLDGVEFPVESFDYRRAPEGSRNVSALRGPQDVRGGPAPYEVAVEMTCNPGTYERLTLFLFGPRFFFTLERRLKYKGGRKSRSALRRIRTFWRRRFNDEYPGPSTAPMGVVS